MRPSTGLQIPMTPEEKSLLREDAERNLRNPRDHARYLLRVALGLPDIRNGTRAVPASEGTGGAVAVITNP